MEKSTPLASLDLGERNQLIIRLVTPAGRPAMCEIQWPERPTATTTSSLDQVIAQVMRTLSVASVRLAQGKANGRIQ
jgi:DNA-binding SARP family transcriptional activator